MIYDATTPRSVTLYFDAIRTPDTERPYKGNEKP
ncbi:hypothetical protein ES703_50685 [subsurface metagenome]